MFGERRKQDTLLLQVDKIISMQKNTGKAYT